MRSIDPSRSQLRKAAIIVVKSAIKVLIENYPMVSFHQVYINIILGYTTFSNRYIQFNCFI